MFKQNWLVWYLATMRNSLEGLHVRKASRVNMKLVCQYKIKEFLAFLIRN